MIRKDHTNLDRFRSLLFGLASPMNVASILAPKILRVTLSIAKPTVSTSHHPYRHA